MSYKYSSGSVRRGDIYYEDDREGQPTYIDFEQDTITLRPSGTAQLYVEDGKVGIGTTSPDHTLHVKSPGTCHVKIESEAGDESALKLSQDGQSSAYVWMPGSTSDLRFYVNSADRMHIDNDGNIGIATTDPSEILTLNATEATILFQEGGTDMATIGVNSSDNILIENKTMNKHIVFKVNDQGTVREGLRLDGAVPEVVVNQAADSLVDFRVESDNNTHMLFVDGSADKVGIDTNSPKTALDVHHNPTALSNDTGGGEVVTFGGGSNLTAGKIYYLNSSGTWTETDADAIATSDGLLAIALGATPGTHGMLLRGFFDATTYLSNFISGLPVYLSTTAASMDTTLPSGTGDIVRCIGYCTNTANVIYFNPESTTLELS